MTSQATKGLIETIPNAAIVNYRRAPDAPAETSRWADQDRDFKAQLIGAEHQTCIDDGAFDSIDLAPSQKTIHTITLREGGETLEVVWSE